MSSPNSTALLDDKGRAQIKEIVCEILEIDPNEITDGSLFKEDHGADSLRAIEILAALERTFGVTIDQEELDRMVNLEGVYSVVSDAPRG
jgi:acyl carrier protein